MGDSNFSAFKKEIEKIGLKKPKLIFSHQTITLITSTYFNDILLLLLLCGASFLFIFEVAVLFLSVMCFVAFCYFFYFCFIGLGICQIDFSTNTINYKNRIFLFNLFRKKFGLKPQINFADIKGISLKEGLLLDRFSDSSFNVRYHILIETYKDPGVIITQVKTKKEAQLLISVLQKFLIHKEKIIA